MGKPVKPLKEKNVWVRPPPPQLYRAFGRREHAQTLVQEGLVHMREIRHFANLTNDPRSDPTEGTGHLIVPGEDSPVNYRPSTTQAVYLFCTSGPAVSPDTLCGFGGRLGAHVVVIDDPEAFTRVLAGALGEDLDGREVLWLDGTCVRYDKGLEGDDPDDAFSPTAWRMIYAQKPPQYAPEHEYRYVVALEGGYVNAPEFIQSKINDRSMLRLDERFPKCCT